MADDVGLTCAPTRCTTSVVPCIGPGGEPGSADPKGSIGLTKTPARCAVLDMLTSELVAHSIAGEVASYKVRTAGGTA